MEGSTVLSPVPRQDCNTVNLTDKRIIMHKPIHNKDLESGVRGESNRGVGFAFKSRSHVGESKLKSRFDLDDFCVFLVTCKWFIISVLLG